MSRWIMGLLFLGWAQTGFALAADVGMVTQLDGKVEVVSARAGKSPAAAFLKVALGDRLVLGGGARVQIVYFETSRQEVWKGDGIVEIGGGEGRSAVLKPEVRKLPPLVARQLVKTPVSGQHGKTGMVTVRSLSSDTVESLEKQYQEFRATAEEGDTTPEVFLLTGLMEMKEFEQAKTVLEGLRAKTQATPGLAAVVSHFEPLIQRGLAGQ